MNQAARPKSMPVLRLTSPHSPAALEQHAIFLAERDRDEQVDLQLPSTLKGDDLGGLGAVGQLILTWARRPTPGVLRTYVPAASDGDVDGKATRDRLSAIETLVESDHGLLALLMSRRAVDVKGESLLGLTTPATADRLLRTGQVATARRGSKVALFAADHRSNNAPFALYQPRSSGAAGQAVRTRDEFESLAHELLKVIGVGASSDRPSPEQQGSLGTVLYQLFRNTHDWARTTVDDRKYERSVRILRSEYVGDSLATHLKHAEGDPGLQAYLKHDVHQGAQRVDAKKDMRRFLEVSILDSGPGLAARMLDSQRLTDPSLEQEHTALLACLKKHMTTSQHPGRGNGLHVVQELMTELRGYMKVRSGRLAMVRDYVQNPYTHSDEQEPWLTDWRSGSGTPTGLAPVVGTFISFVIPIKYLATGAKRFPSQDLGR
ncbi:MAG: hypothetical protein NVSMB48_09140 [Marmoricola sp.]